MKKYYSKERNFKIEPEAYSNIQLSGGCYLEQDGTVTDCNINELNSSDRYIMQGNVIDKNYEILECDSGDLTYFIAIESYYSNGVDSNWTDGALTFYEFCSSNPIKIKQKDSNKIVLYTNSELIN
jgi:hypothetical protein